MSCSTFGTESLAPTGRLLLPNKPRLGESHRGFPKFPAHARTASLPQPSVLAAIDPVPSLVPPTLPDYP